ncbi:MAG: D-alanine--D-alanine ligase [Labilithrix sp.]|nr:D-alanine--D-alanine ligase [Labilithrix sp.]MBX3220001.1 D-alanine--D-alanine ligase [Labilithrix sp.]
MSKRRVGVLMGGTSAEREISLRTGEGVAKALESRGHDVVRVALGAGKPADQAVREASIDVAFLALHGRLGEDGCIQGMLEMMGIPYTGSSVLGSALAMDKLKAKEMFRLHNIPTPPYYVATEADLLELEALHGSFGFPVIVKPRGEGSSVGLTMANDLGELRAGLESALDHDRFALVERFVKATEVHVGILDGRVLGAIEVVPKKGLYDYSAKYTPGETEYILPPRIAPTRTRGVMNLAERAARALGVTGACRVDLLVTEGENEYVLEVNTLPGMTPTSLLPKISAHAGIDYASLCEAILEGATLHAGAAPRRSASEERPQSGVTFRKSDLALVQPERKVV